MLLFFQRLDDEEEKEIVLELGDDEGVCREEGGVKQLYIWMVRTIWGFWVFPQQNYPLLGFASIFKMCKKGGGQKDVCLTTLRGGLQWVVIFELAS